jgi:hypothetical protein
VSIPGPMEIRPGTPPSAIAPPRLSGLLGSRRLRHSPLRHSPLRHSPLRHRDLEGRRAARRSAGGGFGAVVAVAVADERYRLDRQDRECRYEHPRLRVAPEHRGYLPLAQISTARTPTSRVFRRLGARHTHPGPISSASSGLRIVAEGCSPGILDSAASGFPLSCCPRRTKQERRHPNEKVLRVAQYADGSTRRAGARRGRKRLPLLRLLLGEDGLAPRLLLAARRAHTTRNERRRGDHPRCREAPRGTSRANPQGISCGPGLCHGLCHGLSLRPGDETLAASPSPIHRTSWMGLFSGVRGVYPGGAGSLEVDIAHDEATQLPKAMRGHPGSILAARRLPLGRVRRPRRPRSGASGYSRSSRHLAGRARLGGCPRAARQEDAMRLRGLALL